MGQFIQHVVVDMVFRPPSTRTVCVVVIDADGVEENIGALQQLLSLSGSNPASAVEPSGDQQ